MMTAPPTNPPHAQRLGAGASASNAVVAASATGVLTAVILAAGQSKRMGSDLVKVLHPVCGRPMVEWVIDACRESGCRPIHLVVGHQADQVRAALAGRNDLRYVQQMERKGTGHAVLQVEPALRGFVGEVVILAGDGVLVRGETLRRLVETHRTRRASATIVTATIRDPANYGRVVRDSQGRFERIVEERDATPAELAIHEINPSYYCFDSTVLFPALHRVTPSAASGEYYLTDVLSVLRCDGKTIETIAVDESEVLSINTPEQLQEVAAILQMRVGCSTGPKRTETRGGGR